MTNAPACESCCPSFAAGFGVHYSNCQHYAAPTPEEIAAAEAEVDRRLLRGNVRWEFVRLAPTLKSTIAQRYVLMRYGLGEPRLVALAIAGHFQDSPLDVEEAETIAAEWHS